MKYKETTFKEFYQCQVGVLRLKLAFKPEAGPRQKKDGFKLSFGPVLQHSRGNIDAMTRGRPGAILQLVCQPLVREVISEI